jgi:protein O-GlcNAcase/histone acetyltransferase
MDSNFLSGVIEGFYGPPWTPAERRQLFDQLGAAGLNTYLYAPKDDLKHRALWRERYSDAEAGVLADAIAGCRACGLGFVYGISPGLDIRYAREADGAALLARFEQVLGLGGDHLALLFDDVPDRLHPDDLARFGSLAAAQCHVANSVWAWARHRTPGARLLFCPTPYCGRMARQGLGGPGYLDVLGRNLDAGIDVCWTGPEIVSPEIAVDHVRELQRTLRRKPVIWDNLHANDYDARRFYCGPYAGRRPELREEAAGILINPNCEFALNDVPVRTFGAFVSAKSHWNPRAAYLDAMEAWLPRFDSVGQPISLDDLILLGDCFYLPHEDGPEASALLASAQQLCRAGPEARGADPAAFRDRAGRLRRTCAAVADLRDRALSHALFRPVWELREELDLLLAGGQAWQQDPGAPLRSDFHLPRTYRGSLVARLQRLLDQRPDGTFVRAIVPNEPMPAPDSP